MESNAMNTPIRQKPAPSSPNGTTTTPKSARTPKQKCPCKWRGAPICTCRHKKSCPIASVPPTPHPSPAASSPWKYGKYLRQSSGPTRISGSGAFTKTPTMPSSPAIPSAPSTPLPSSSAYDMGYDRSMSLSRTVEPVASAASQVNEVQPVGGRTEPASARTDPVSVITPLPSQVTRVFGGRVTKRKQRPKDIKIPKSGDAGNEKPCLCDLKCDCICATQSSPVAMRRPSFFDKEVIR